jgi:GNAT superfamily N-acetyltransferase
MNHLGWTPEDVSKMSEQVASGHGPARLVLDRVTGRPLGCVLAHRVYDTLTIVGWIGVPYRRQGYGSEALEFLCLEAFAGGCRSVLVALPASNPELVPFVEQRRFVPTGTHQFVNHHDEVMDTVLYRRVRDQARVQPPD